MDIQHFFFATEVLPRIFPKNFWIKGKNSFFWNPENNPFFSFDRSLDYVLLRGDLLSPYLFFGNKYSSVIHIASHLMVYSKAPIGNTAMIQEFFQSWQEVARSANVFCGCGHKILVKIKTHYELYYFLNSSSLRKIAPKLGEIQLSSARWSASVILFLRKIGSFGAIMILK